MNSIAATPPGRPTIEHLLLLRRLRRQLLRSQSAQLLYLWGDDPRSLAWLQGELDRTLRARSRRLLSLPALANGEPDVEPALRAVLLPPPGTGLFGLWVELGDARGAFRRDWLLARLNERRAGLLDHARPVLLVGRADAEVAVAMVAPDLWSIRSASFAVPGWAIQAEQALSPTVRWTDDGRTPTPGRMPRVELWDRAVAAFAKAIGELQPDDQEPPTLALDLGIEAAFEALSHVQIPTAERILHQTAERVEADPDDSDVAAIRMLHAQRWAEGNLAMARRQFLDGRTAYAQMLQVSERLVSLTSASPEALRLRLASLGKLAEVQVALGDMADAQAKCEQVLDVSEKLVALEGESPRALRDWTVSLHRLGDVQRAQGDPVGARARHEQGLKVSERLVELTSESPQALRDWTVSLEKVGDAQRALGDLSGAAARYEQSLAVSLQLLALTGDSPEALRDWSVSLERLGDVQRALGDISGAKARYEQSLEVSERLVLLTGESPESLRDLSVSMNKLGDVERALGDMTGGRQRHEQSVKLSQRLVELTGRSPIALRDLANSLERLGDACLELASPAEARDFFERGLAAAEAALRQSPLSQDIQAVVDNARAKLAALPPIIIIPKAALT